MNKKLISLGVVLFLFFGLEMTTTAAGGNKVPGLDLKVLEKKIQEDLIEEEFFILDWNEEPNVKIISSERFSQIKAGDTIEFEVEPTNKSYSRVYLLDTEWKNYLFKNINCSPEVGYTSQRQQDGNTITKIPLYYSDEGPVTFKVKITVTKEEAEHLKEKGLQFNGNSYYVKSLKLNYTKTEISSSLSLKQQYKLYEEQRNAEIKKYSKKYKTPMIFITTKNRQNVTTEEFQTAIIDVVNCEDEYKLSEKGEVRVRGNSTASEQWAPVYKPFKIKFDKKQSMLGLNEGREFKSWVLLKAECFSADHLGFNLAKEIYKTSKFDYYVSDSRYVHVFINEQYKGMYLLCEQNQVGEGRVSVNPNKEKSKDFRTGYMLELDNYAWEDVHEDWEKNHKAIGHFKWPNGLGWKGVDEYHLDLDYKWNGKEVQLTDINGYTAPLGWKRVADKDWTIEYGNDSFTIKSDIYSDEQVAFIAEYMKGIWDICYNAIEKGKYYKFNKNYKVVPAPEFKNAKQACEAVIDLESLCNEMILEELVRDNDVGSGSLYMAMDFSVKPGEKYEKLTFECPWDFNWAYQETKNDGDKGNFWKGKKQYFAGAWQNPYLSKPKKGDTIYERSHCWFILFNNAPWFRKMLREKWNQIGPERLKKLTQEIDKEISIPMSEQNHKNGHYYTGYVRDRIEYIDKCLWK